MAVLKDGIKEGEAADGFGLLTLISNVLMRRGG
ncbi:hypothetical protein R80B4_01369 [Fibrobacteres bacterium R8-0-B4]